MLTAPELCKEANAHAPAAAEASQQDAVSGCDPDTAAHDQQTPPRLRESAAHIASTEQCPSEGRLHSPRRSLKALLGSPGRKSSPRRLARSSLRLSSSNSPMKPPAAAGTAAFAACECSSGSDQQQQQQQLQLKGPHKAQSPGVREAQGPAAAASSTDDLDAAQQVGTQPRSALQQIPPDAGAAAASAGVSDSNKPANSKPAFRAAAATAAAVQQSLSAARAAIAAAEAVRGQSHVSTARSHRGGSAGSNEAASAAAGTSALSGAAAEKSAALIPAGSMEAAAPVVSSLHVDTAAADLGKEGSGLDCKSSSSDGSAWGGPSHKLPACIVSDPQEPAGGPTAVAAAAADSQSASLTDSSTLQQGPQAGSSAAAVAICPLWQPEQLSSQPVSQLVSNLSCKGQSSSSSHQGSPAAATLGPGTAAAHQHTDSSSSLAALPPSEPEQQVQNAAVHASDSDVAALPVQSEGADPSTAEPADTQGAPAAADVQGTAKEAVGSAAENAAIPAVPAAQSASCSPGAGAPAFAAAGRDCRPPSACAAVRSAARPPLPPVPAASAAQHAALKLAYVPRHRQACSSKSHSAAGAQPAVEGSPSLPQLPHPRLQEQQQGLPPKAAAVGAVGPMHAAAFGPQQHAQFSTSSTQAASSGHAQGSSMPEYKAPVYKTGHQAAAAAAACCDDEDIYAHLPPVPEVYKASTLCTRQQQPRQRQLMPRRLYSDDTGNDTSSDRQRLLPPQNSSLHGPPAWSAAAARASAARPAHAAAQLEKCYAAVSAPAEAAPTSCLSPLHWHQSNLGSSRAGFYQAMVSC